MKELNTIQSELHAPKNLRNNFGGYNYRSAEGILEAVKPFLQSLECTLTISDSITEIGGRIYVVATATLRNSKGEVESTSAYAREEETKKGMDAAQITGSASSYARKYALNGLFCLDDTKDPDATNDGTDKGCKVIKPKGTKKAEPTEDDAMQLITIQIQQAKTVEDLTAIWKEWPTMQATIKPMLTAKRKELGL